MLAFVCVSFHMRSRTHSRRSGSLTRRASRQSRVLRPPMRTKPATADIDRECGLRPCCVGCVGGWLCWRLAVLAVGCVGDTPATADYLCIGFSSTAIARLYDQVGFVVWSSGSSSCSGKLRGPNVARAFFPCSRSFQLLPQR